MDTVRDACIRGVRIHSDVSDNARHHVSTDMLTLPLNLS